MYLRYLVMYAACTLDCLQRVSSLDVTQELS